MINPGNLALIACVLASGSAGNCTSTPKMAGVAPSKQQAMSVTGVSQRIAPDDINRVTIYRDAVNREGPYRKENLLSELSKTCSIKSTKQFTQAVNQWLNSATRAEKPQNPFFNTAVKFDGSSGKSRLIYFFFDTKSKLQKINLDEKEYSVPANFDNNIMTLSRASCGVQWDFI
jgi:hypothetical protein